MSRRITANDVRNAFTALQHTATRMGVPDADRWVLVEGSVTYGRHWYITLVDTPGGGHRVVEYLDASPTTSHMMLAAMRVGLMMADAR